MHPSVSLSVRVYPSQGSHVVEIPPSPKPKSRSLFPRRCPDVLCGVRYPVPVLSWVMSVVGSVTFVDGRGRRDVVRLEHDGRSETVVMGFGDWRLHGVVVRLGDSWRFTGSFWDDVVYGTGHLGVLHGARGRKGKALPGT